MNVVREAFDKYRCGKFYYIGSNGFSKICKGNNGDFIVFIQTGVFSFYTKKLKDFNTIELSALILSIKDDIKHRDETSFEISESDTAE